MFFTLDRSFYIPVGTPSVRADYSETAVCSSRRLAYIIYIYFLMPARGQPEMGSYIPPTVAFRVRLGVRVECPICGYKY